MTEVVLDLQNVLTTFWIAPLDLLQLELYVDLLIVVWCLNNFFLLQTILGHCAAE